MTVVIHLQGIYEIIASLIEITPEMLLFFSQHFILRFQDRRKGMPERIKRLQEIVYSADEGVDCLLEYLGLIQYLYYILSIFINEDPFEAILVHSYIILL